LVNHVVPEIDPWGCMPHYSPFTKELPDIVADDLEALQSTAEGWYVEYKRETPNASSMAKSATAFANTYGGWLFYGIAESSKDGAVAGSFPGIPRADVDPALQRFRQAIANHANPSPHFETHVVWGPSAKIDLPADHAIICVYIPWGPNAPYVHRGGHIYRRVADGSEPKPESDRFVLDQLWQRSAEATKYFARWIEREPNLSKKQEGIPYLRLLLVADLWDDRKPWLGADVATVRAIMRGTVEAHTTMPYDTVHTSAKGFVARQTRGNDPNGLLLTWRLSRDLSSEILFPLSWFRVDDLAMLLDYLEGYEQIERFVKIMEDRGFERAKIIDLNVIYRVLVGISEMYNRILNAANWSHGYHMKAVIVNAERTVPFLDLSRVFDDFETYGVPMLLDRRVTAPPGKDPESFQAINLFDDTTDEQAKAALQAILMFGPIAEAFGLPSWFNTDDGEEDWWMQLSNAGQRSINRQTTTAKPRRVRS